MNEVTRCPHCATRMVVTAQGSCPACGKLPSAPIVPPPPPPVPPPRHPVLFLFCVVLMIIGFWRNYAREHQVMESVIIDLMLIWAGALGILALAAVRHAHQRRQRRPSKPG